MKLRFLLLLFCFTVVSSPVKSKDTTGALADSSSLFNPAYADRIILLGFSDRHIKRIQRTAHVSSYRRRGPYQSSTWSRHITSKLEQEYNLSKITEWPMTEVGIHCAVYLIPRNQSMAQVIALLSQDPRVEIVQRMNNYTTEAKIYNDPYFQLQSNIQEMQVDSVHGTTTGQNITIALIDTGVDIDHPDLRGKVDFNENFVSRISSGISDDKHGTAVAGIMVAHSNNGIGIIGVAPDARLVVLKACWPNQKDSYESICNSFTLALAVNKAIQLGVNVINMSLSGPYDPLLAKLLNKAMSEGIVVVAADPGLTAHKERFPASLTNVIPVQESMRSDSGKLLQSQSINAPGENILTTLPHGTYDFVSGCSLAAAQVSGIIALLIELKPNLTLAETRTILQNSSAATASETPKKFFQGINAKTAVTELCKSDACSFSL